MESQKEKVAVLLNLIKENPDVEILPMVHRDCIFDDSWAYWMAKWSSAELDKYYVSSERVYKYSDDFEELVERWIDNNYEDYEGLTDDELEAKATEIINGYEWTDAIIVYIESL